MVKQYTPDEGVDTCQQILRECGVFNLRKASRIVTQLYDDILQPTGLRSTQAVVLVMLEVEQELSMARMAHELVLSPSTLSRNLARLEQDGLIETHPTGKRGKSVKLTARGRRALHKVLPYWQKAQQKFTGQVGVGEWADLRKHLNKTVTAVRG